jgi:molybdate transport system substrate-binding protein
VKDKIVKAILVLLIGIILTAGMFGCSQSTTTTTASTVVPSSIQAVNKEIMVFAGAASKPPLDEAAEAFSKQTGIKVYCTYGGSGSVLSQMELSKTGDLYIPGSPDYIPKAERKNLIDPTTTTTIVYLVPVIAVQHGNPKNIQSFADLAKPGMKVGIGNPESVCLGLYSVEVLDYNNLLADVFKNIVTQAASCDATATLISLKSVDAVIGWDVFHYWDPENIDVVYLKPEQIPRIAYIPAAISTFTKDRASAKAFIDFLTSNTGQEIFKKWGYIASEAEAKKYAPAANVGGEYQLPESYKALLK